MVLRYALEKGFTVIELMVVVAIMGIMATIAVPAFQDWMTHSAVNNATATVISKLKQARNIAVAENRNITVSFTPYAFVYDVDAYAPKQPEVVELKQFSKTVWMKKNNGATLVFKSDGTITGNTTMKIMQGTNYYQCVTVNGIGRSYLSTMASATATCKGL